MLRYTSKPLVINVLSLMIGPVWIATSAEADFLWASNLVSNTLRLVTLAEAYFDCMSRGSSVVKKPKA